MRNTLRENAITRTLASRKLSHSVFGFGLTIILVAQTCLAASKGVQTSFPLCAGGFDDTLEFLENSVTGTVPQKLKEQLPKVIHDVLGPLAGGQTTHEYYSKLTPSEKSKLATQLTLRAVIPIADSLSESERELFRLHPLAVLDYVQTITAEHIQPNGVRPFRQTLRAEFAPATPQEEAQFLEQMPDWAVYFELAMRGDEWSVGQLVRSRLKGLSRETNLLAESLVRSYFKRHPNDPSLVLRKQRLQGAIRGQATLLPSDYWLLVDRDFIAKHGTRLLENMRVDTNIVTLENRLLALEYIYLQYRTLPDSPTKDNLRSNILWVIYGPTRHLFHAAFESNQIPPGLIEAKKNLNLKP